MKVTQKQAILSDLINGHKITPIDALTKHGCFRLAAVVCQLRKDGYNITTNNVPKNSGNGTYASYKLHKSTWF